MQKKLTYIETQRTWFHSLIILDQAWSSIKSTSAIFCLPVQAWSFAIPAASTTEPRCIASRSSQLHQVDPTHFVFRCVVSVSEFEAWDIPVIIHWVSSWASQCSHTTWSSVSRELDFNHLWRLFEEWSSRPIGRWISLMSHEMSWILAPHQFNYII